MRRCLVFGVAALAITAAGCRTQGQSEGAVDRAKGLLAQVRSPNAGTEDALTVYVDDAPPAQPTDEERGGGFIVFSRPMTQPLFPAAVPKPEERVRTLTVAACAGEYEPAILAVFALQDLSDVRVSVGDLTGPQGPIPAASIEVRSVRVQPKLGQKRWGPYQETLMEVPLFLEQRDAVSIPANRNQSFWLTVHVPEDAAAGEYSGTINVAAAPGPGAEVPLTVRVRGFRLAEPTGIRFGMYDKLRTDPAWLSDTFADLRAHGMTSMSLTEDSGLALQAQAGQVSIDWTGQSALELTMTAYAKAGFPEPVTWVWGRDLVAFCETVGPVESQAFADAYRQTILAINEHGKQCGWPEIIYAPVDEPFDDPQQLALAMRLWGILKSIPGVRVEGNGMNGQPQNFTDDAYRLLDVMVLHDGPVLKRGRLDLTEWWAYRDKCVRDGKHLEFYNIDLTTWRPEPLRYMTGFGLWKAGVQGSKQWAYMWAPKEDDPAWIYSQPRPVVFRYPKAPGESGGPTIGWEGIREGVDDYRYLLTLAQFVDRARKAGKGALGDQVWRPVQTALDAATFDNCTGKAAQGDWTGECETRPDGTRVVRGDMKIDNKWGFGDYDALRETIAEGIEKLQEAVGQ